MKKIVSILAAMTMAASVSSMAFAAIPSDAVAPKAEIIIEDTGDRDGDLALYSMVCNLSDLGTVTHNKISATKFSGTKIVQFNYEVQGEDLAYVDASGELSTAGWTGSGDSSKFTGVYVSYANTTAKTAFPSAVASATSCDEAVLVQFYGIPGNTITIANGKIGYLTFGDDGKASGKTEYLPVTFNATNFTLPGGTEEETCADLKVGFEGKFDNGYVWKADLTKGTKDIASFKAKFEAGEAVAERQIKNIADLTSKFDGEGKVSFNIGLETKKELTKATFTVNDGDDHAVEAPVK